MKQKSPSRKNTNNCLTYTKNEQAITLIVLVITIAVLIILAGVSIAMLTGDNGILTMIQEALKNTKIAEKDEELRAAYNYLLIEYNNGKKDVFQENNLMDNLNKQLSGTKIERGTIYYNHKLVQEEKINELEPVYKYSIGEDKNIFFTISESGVYKELKTLQQSMEEYDKKGINVQAGKWVSYPIDYTNSYKDYAMNDALLGWRILSNGGKNSKIITAGIPSRYEYNHNKTIVDDWNDFSKFEQTKFTWGLANVKDLKEKRLSIGIRSINYKDIKEVTPNMHYIPSYINGVWGNEEWPNRLRGLIGCGNEYIVATWQHKESDSLYYMSFPYDKYGMSLNSTGYLYYPGVRVVAYLKEDISIYQTEYFNGSSKNQPLLLVN